MEQIIEIRVGSGRRAVQLKSHNEEFIIDEIEVGSGKLKKEIKYTAGFLQSGTECRAIIIKQGKLRIIL